MARLDRLGPAREVAQIGAVIGRDFSYALLRAVAGMDDAPLQAALERLAEADILLVQGLPPDADYRFKHALIQDAAYENLLKSRRQVLHRRVAEILRDSSPTRCGRAGVAGASLHPGGPDRGCHRMVGQGRRPGAAPLGLPGGDRPSRQGDRDGGQGGEGAMAATAPTPGGQRLKLQSSLATLFAGRGRHGGLKRRRPSARARSLLRGSTIQWSGSQPTTASGSANRTRGETRPRAKLRRRCRRTARVAPQSADAGVANRIDGATHRVTTGEVVAARDQLEQALAIFDAERDRDLPSASGRTSASPRWCLPLALWPLGETDRGEA